MDSGTRGIYPPNGKQQQRYGSLRCHISTGNFGYKISKKLFWKTGFHRLEAGKKEKGQSRKKDTIFGSRYFQRGYSESSL